MNYQKKINRILILSILFIGLNACTDNSYKGYNPPIEIDDNSLMPILLSLGGTNYSVTTRGSGAIEDEGNDDIWDNSFIYFFAFLQNETTDFREHMEEIINEDEIKLPACLIDGSGDDPHSLLGKKARVMLANTTIEWTGKSPIYYSSAKDPYDFYGYYLDDITPKNISRTSNSISFEIEIDGTQDIMSSKAEISSDQLLRLQTYSAMEQETILNSLYSSYTARRSFQPIMVFRHQLVRLKFQIYAAKPEAKDVFVKSLELNSQTKGRFTVVDKVPSNIGIVFEGQERPLLLKDPKGEILRENYYTPIYKEGESENIFDRIPVKVGESMLVAPASSYRFTLALEQEKDGKKVPYLTTDQLKMSNGEMFETGKEYIVRIAIYGIEEVEITVIPEGWVDGGNIDIDPDDNF